MKTLLYSLVPLTLFALPSNMVVQHGNVDHALDGNAMTLKTGKGAIINWQDFSIQAGESVHIKQAGPKSKVLNRVTGGMRSDIHGRLESNGKVYLVNPAGVLIGPEGHVRCAGFIASTTDIANDEFLRGRTIRQDSLQGEISVLGRIEGPTSLYAKCIKHQGVIDANQVIERDGKVLIVANNCCEALQNPIHAKQVKLVAMAAINIDAAAAMAASTSLDAGTDVTFSTGAGAFDITMDPVTISWSLAPSQLTLEAGRSVSLTNASTISCTHTGSGAFDAIELSGNIISGPFPTDGGINITDGTIGSTEGNISLTGSNMPDSPDDAGILISGGTIESTGTGANPANIVLTGTNTPSVGAGDQQNGATLTGGIISTINGDISISGDALINNFFSHGLRFGGTCTISSTGSGDMNYDGIVDAAMMVSGSFCDGILYHFSSPGFPRVSSSGSGSQTHIGQGALNAPPTTRSHSGIQTVLSADVSTASGDLVLHGKGGTGRDSEGISINATSSSQLSTGSGLLSMTGVATSTAGTTDEGYGIFLSGTGSVDIFTDSGNLVMNGTGDIGSSSPTDGVQVAALSTVSSNSGLIDITGTSRSTGIGGTGTNITSTGLISNTTGDINITGTSSPNGISSQLGVSIQGFGRVVNTSGTTTINGTALAGSPSAGISITSTNVPAALETDTGTITLNGTSNTTMGSSPGLNISSTAIVRTTDSGTINGTSRGALGGVDSPGVLVTGVGTTISTTTGGTIDLEGIGRSPDADCDGFQLIGGANVLANSGSATIRGTYEGSGSPSNHGVIITGLGSVLSSTTGDANATGTQLASAGPGYGVALIGATPLVTSTSGDITVRGIAPNNNLGILVNSGIIMNGTGSTLLQTLSDIDVNNGATITSGGPITFNSARDINVTGSDIVPTMTTISSSAPVLLIADRNINIFEGTVTVANIESTGSNLTFVVDDEFPAFPNRGAGQFNLGPNNLITAAGELRVYTVQPSQNTIIAPLNGQLFVPGPFNVNSATEQWVTWFPDGSYGGANFRIYYKIGSIPDAIRAGQVAVSELLTDFVPVIQLQPFFSNSGNFVSNYHGKFGMPWEYYRDPRFEPYSSFIFEDTLFWTDR